MFAALLCIRPVKSTSTGRLKLQGAARLLGNCWHNIHSSASAGMLKQVQETAGLQVSSVHSSACGGRLKQVQGAAALLGKWWYNIHCSTLANWTAVSQISSRDKSTTATNKFSSDNSFQSTNSGKLAIVNNLGLCACMVLTIAMWFTSHFCLKPEAYNHVVNTLLVMMLMVASRSN